MALKAFLAVLLPVPGTVRAQATDAVILGRVTDTAGQAIAGATIIARNGSTGLTWTVHTNSSGRYTFVELPLGGPYSIDARMVGYRPETRSGYELRLGRRSVVDIALVPTPLTLPDLITTGTEEE